MACHKTSALISISSSSTFWNLIIFILNLTSFIFTSQLSFINQSTFIQLYHYYPHVLK